MIEALKTDQDLIERLQKSASKRVSKAELEHQRASFVFGNLPHDSTITRERVEKRLQENDGA